MIRRIILTLFASFSIALYAIPSVTAHAAPCEPGNSVFLGLPTWYKYLEGQPNPAGGCDVILDGLEVLDITVPVGMAILEILFRIIGIVAVFMVIRGGFAYVTSQGNPGETKVAKDRIVNAFIGLAISLIATSSITFFYGRIIQ